jgi:hypothetical protein
VLGGSLALRRRTGWGLGDQAVSSITNALLAIIVARSVDASSFGAFGLAFSIYSIAVGVSRALCSQPLSIRYASAPPEPARAAVARSTGCALVLGVGIGALCAGSGLLIGGTTGGCLVALGATLPGLLLQDAWRYVFFTVARPAAALVNDAFWGVTQIALLVVILYVGGPDVDGQVAWLLGAWGAAAAASAALGAWQARTWPAPLAARRWLAEHRATAPFLAGEYLVNLGAFNAALAIIGALGWLSIVGAIRGAQVLLGPLRVFTQAAQSFGLSEVARRAAGNPGGLLRDCALVSLALGGMPAVATGLYVLMPDAWGRAMLGDTWSGAREVLVPVGGQLVATGILGGALLGLQTLGHARLSFAASLAQAPFTLVLGVGGALVVGLVGAATGFALAHCIAPAVCWCLLVTRQRAHLHTLAGGPKFGGAAAAPR